MEIRYQLRYRRPAVLGRGRAAEASPNGPAYTPAAPEPPVSMLASLFGTTVAMPCRELLQEWELAK